MSATGQGQAGGDGGQASQGEGQGQAGLADLSTQVGAPDNATLEEMRQTLQFIQQQVTPQQAEPETEQVPEIDLSFLDETVDPAVQQQMVQEQFERIADQRAQAHAAPIMERMEKMRLETEAQNLTQQYPELEDMENARKLAGPGGLVEQALQHAPPDVAAKLGAEPWFWGLVHSANKAHETANAEPQGSGDPGAAHLESGNGAGPGMTQEDRVKQIMEAGGRGSRVLDGI